MSRSRFGRLLARMAALALCGLVVPASPLLTASAACAETGDVAAGSPATERTLDHPEVTLEEQVAVEAQTQDLLRRRGRPDAEFRGAVIPVYVHKILASDGSGDVSDDQIIRQIQVLNESFAGRESPEAANTGFRFRLISIEETRNDRWQAGLDDHVFRTQLRHGGLESLNIWILDLPSGLGGYVTFPWWNSTLDGVALDLESLPGGAQEGYNQGDVGTHEVGHWLGLWHTFDFGCSEQGDFVDDTPAEAGPAASGVCSVRDSCPAPGTDPVHNYMDYAGDECANQFTTGQAKRMREIWLAYRVPSAFTPGQDPDGTI